MALFTVGRILSIFLLFTTLSFINDSTSTRKAMADELLVRLYFVVPFSLETYTPITMENIEEDSRLVWFMKENQFIAELARTLQAHPSQQKILSKGIRLKADFGTTDGVFFVDQNGTVLRKDNKATFRLSVKELERLEKQLESFIGVVDVKAYERYMKDKKEK